MRKAALLICSAIILLSVFSMRKKAVFVTNDEELYAQIAEPLLNTVESRGKPISVIGDSIIEFQYAFYDSTKRQTYLIIIDRFLSAGVYTKGSVKGVIASPWNREQRNVPLSEFVSRMILSQKNAGFTDDEACLKTPKYFWCIETTPDENGLVLLDIQRRDAKNHWPVKIRP